MTPRWSNGYWAAIHRRLAWIERRLLRCRREGERAALEEERFDLRAALEEITSTH